MEIIKVCDIMFDAAIELIEANEFKLALELMSNCVETYKKFILSEHKETSNFGSTECLDNSNDNLTHKSEKNNHNKHDVSVQSEDKQSQRSSAPNFTNSGFELQNRNQNIILKAQIQSCKLNNVTGLQFSQIKGLDEIKSSVLSAIEMPFKYKEAFPPGIAPPYRILLYGLPGTGKTQLAKACINQGRTSRNAEVYSVSASTIMNRYYGDSEKAVKLLFAELKSHPFSILVMDEVDQLLTTRGSNSSEGYGKVVTEFLMELDGIGGELRNVMIIATTNRPYDIDAAIMSRFESKFHVPLPSLQGRTEILKSLVYQVNSDISDPDFCKLGSQTDGFSGRDLTYLIRRAWSDHVLRHGNNWSRESLKKSDLEVAIASFERTTNSDEQGKLDEYLSKTNNPKACGSKSRPMFVLGF